MALAFWIAAVISVSAIISKGLIRVKKALSVILTVMILCLICTGAAFADLYGNKVMGGSAKAAFPSIDEVLSDLNSYSGKVEVRDDLSEYDPDNFGEIDYGDFKCVILERHLPEKEFSKHDSGYPDHYMNDFPEGFKGNDIGVSRIWVCCDLMKQLPEYIRAVSMEDADIIIMAETQYSLSGSITVSDYEKSGTEEIPEFETIDEMVKYMQEHQPVIEKIWRYPKFLAYSIIDIYSPDSKKRELYDYTYVLPKRFASNPEAAEQWVDMQDLSEASTELMSEDPDVDSVKQILEGFKDQLPQNKLEFWQSCIDSGEYRSAGFSMNEYFWIMASELMALDPDENHRANYQLVIDAKDLEAFYQLANFCNYSGFDTPIETIKNSKEYMAVPDYNWLDTSLKEIVALLNK